MGRRALVLTLLLAWGCGDDPIEVHRGNGEADYNRAELMAAIDGFVQARAAASRRTGCSPPR
jgi:hypothetical protein